MKINRIELIKAIEKCKNLAKVNKIRPVLEGVLLKTENGILKTISTDLSNTFVINLEQTVDEIAVVFNPNLVLEYIKQLEEEEIDINVENNVMTISDAEFLTYDFEEYPIINVQIDEKSKIKVNSKELFTNLLNTEPAAAINDNLALQCIRLNIKSNKMSLIASDTFRMIKTEQNIESDIEIDCSISTDCLNAIYSILNENEFINISKDDKNIIFFTEKSFLKIRKIDLEFPNWKSIFENFYSEIEVELNTNSINKSLKRINIFNKDNINVRYGATFEFLRNKLEIKGMSEKGKNNEKLEIIKNGNDIKINLNSRYFIEFSNKIKTESIIMKLNKHNSPVLLKNNKDDSILYLMMPLAMSEE